MYTRPGLTILRATLIPVYVEILILYGNKILVIKTQWDGWGERVGVVYYCDEKEKRAKHPRFSLGTDKK